MAIKILSDFLLTDQDLMLITRKKGYLKIKENWSKFNCCHVNVHVDMINMNNDIMNNDKYGYEFNWI